MANGRGLKLHNEYASEFSTYSEIPKAVFAAVAFSFAMRLNGDDMHNAIGAFYREWRTLHENGIIPQAPPRLPTIDPRDEEEVYHLVSPDSLNNFNTPKTAMCGDAPKHLVLDSMSATCKACILAHGLLKIRMSLSADQSGYARLIDELLRRVREAV